jgi:hypothetical protein
VGGVRAHSTCIFCRQGQVAKKGENGLATDGVPYTSEHDIRTVKRKKRSHSESHPSNVNVKLKDNVEALQDISVEADCKDGQDEGPKKKKKRRDSESLNEDNDGE